LCAEIDLPQQMRLSSKFLVVVLDSPAPVAKEGGTMQLPANSESQTTDGSRLADNPSGATTAAHAEIEQAVRAWAQAWSSRNVDNYVASYSDNSFVPEKFPNRDAWKMQRQKVLTSAGVIRVTVTDLQVSLMDENHAKVTFTQEYHSDTHQDRVKKTLLLQKEGGEWKITREYSRDVTV
ncbi:MAG: nuclear transport factor 2 family protein, partial [Magnetococcales bacterium]|nr:nuclear transport factor 2 family protein [Magnetococcales bacterium]